MGVLKQQKLKGKCQMGGHLTLLNVKWVKTHPFKWERFPANYREEINTVTG